MKIYFILLLSRPYPHLGEERGHDTRLRLFNLFSDIGGLISYIYIYIHKKINLLKTTTVVAFKMSCTYTFILQNYYIYLTKQRQNLHQVDFY